MSADATVIAQEPATTKAADLEGALAALAQDYSVLSARMRELQHSVTCECDGVTLRAHFPSITQGKAAVHELLDVMIHFLPWFALPRSEVAAAEAKLAKLDPKTAFVEISKIIQAARALFIKANKATNRSGEAGEFILSILTEWILKAPQLIAKMSLKTNPEMPVHGADGIHGYYTTESKKLVLYWGESKVYTDVGQAMTEAVKSIVEANMPEKQKHELHLVSRYIDFAGLGHEAKTDLLRFLDPFDEAYNTKLHVTTCLIAFNCQHYSSILSEGENAEAKFRALLEDQLAALSKQFGDRLKKANLGHQLVELFLFPVPSVDELRAAFHSKIGWGS